MLCFQTASVPDRIFPSLVIHSFLDLKYPLDIHHSLKLPRQPGLKLLVLFTSYLICKTLNVWMIGSDATAAAANLFINYLLMMVFGVKRNESGGRLFVHFSLFWEFWRWWVLGGHVVETSGAANGLFSFSPSSNPKPMLMGPWCPVPMERNLITRHPPWLTPWIYCFGISPSCISVASGTHQKFSLCC